MPIKAIEERLLGQAIPTATSAARRKGTKQSHHFLWIVQQADHAAKGVHIEIHICGIQLGVTEVLQQHLVMIPKVLALAFAAAAALGQQK